MRTVPAVRPWEEEGAVAEAEQARTGGQGDPASGPPGPPPGLSARQVHRRVAVMWAVGGAFVAGSWFGQWRVDRDRDWQREPLLSTAIDSVRANFLDSLPEDVLIRRAVRGMLHELGDPYAALLDGEGAATYRGTLQGEGQGLGLTVRLGPEGALVRRVMGGSPAATAGVRPGDVVLALNDRPALEVWTPRPGSPSDGDTAATAERPSAEVRLQLLRGPGPDTLSLTLTRSAWHRAAVTEALRLDDTVGYIRLASLARGAADELEAGVTRLRERGVTRLVLDLRGNGGGLYPEGVRAAELFLERGQLVTSLERRGERGLDPQIARRSRWPDLPLVLVVDRQTASAAELLVAALQDHGRALVVGEATYGKAHVQRIVPLSDGLSLRLTTARWVPPSREPVERRLEVDGRVSGGLTPDVTLASAVRPDPAAVPAALSPADARRLSDAADAILRRALRDGWAGAPVPLLERRARAQLDSLLPASTRSASAWSDARRRVLLGDGVRVVVRRLLEVSRDDEALWQYAVTDDAALRAAQALLSPVPARREGRPAGLADGADVPSASAMRAAEGDSSAVKRLTAWTGRRFARRRLDGTGFPLDAAGSAATSPDQPSGTAVIEGRLGPSADTLVALQFVAAGGTPLAASRPAWLVEPTGARTTLPLQVVARLPFRTPRVVDADPARAGDWQHGWAYLLVAGPRVGEAHPGGFAGWRLAGEAPATVARASSPRARTARAANAANAAVAQE